MAEIAVREAVGAEEIAAARRLMQAYAAYLAANPAGAANINIQNFERELAGLPGQYQSPEGILLLAWVDGVAVGCCAVRIVRKHRVPERGCEMKRLWIEPSARGLGLGRRLVEAAIAWATTAGYEAMYLDTVPAAMPQANGMYKAMGFESVERYNDNLAEDVVFFRRKL
ncbi:GNAT family N-acetyltransferase [Granulicella sp. dw_53]|uniref:GNAT family N-acetyltransferase n=1 Tax=Granulicella sp. dw_53 TaxID=2719792 RepID=UPI001BD325C8|nr:GNAT family N-acetyltransferase [Granulicella sp. dw_53]